MQVSHSAVLLCFSLAIATISVKRTGWLDRVVKYHKNLFLKDVGKLTPIQINASIEPIPPGYVDSPNWNYESVIHLLNLIKESKTAKPVRIALRRMFKPNRRFMSLKDSYKFFPSLKQTIPNELYYDYSYEEKSSESKDKVQDDGLIMVTNPVEARLPSGKISIKLLKEIMEARAKAARVLPDTSISPIDWMPMNKTGNGDGGAKDGPGDDAAGGSSTGADATTAAGEAAKTTAASSK